jgi:hypothetical protein
MVSIASGTILSLMLLVLWLNLSATFLIFSVCFFVVRPGRSILLSTLHSMFTVRLFLVVVDGTVFISLVASCSSMSGTGVNGVCFLCYRHRFCRLVLHFLKLVA